MESAPKVTLWEPALCIATQLNFHSRCRIGKNTSPFQLSGYSFNTTCAYNHTTLNTPVLVRSPKLSSVGLGTAGVVGFFDHSRSFFFQVFFFPVSVSLQVLIGSCFWHSIQILLAAESQPARTRHTNHSIYTHSPLITQFRCHWVTICTKGDPLGTGVVHSNSAEFSF